MPKEKAPKMSWEMLEIARKYFLDETHTLSELESFLRTYIAFRKGSVLVTKSEMEEMEKDYNAVIQELELKGKKKSFQKESKLIPEIEEIKNRYSPDRYCNLRKLETILKRHASLCETDPSITPEMEIQIMRDYNIVADALCLAREQKNFARMEGAKRRQEKLSLRLKAAY